MARADLLGERGLRANFLQNIPAHRAIVRAHAERFGRS
jgi:hypothetical protein